MFTILIIVSTNIIKINTIMTSWTQFLVLSWVPKPKACWPNTHSLASWSRQSSASIIIISAIHINTIIVIIINQIVNDKKQAAYLLIAVGSLIFVIAFLGYCGALQVFRTMMVLMTMMMTMVKMMMMMMMMFRKVVCYSQPMRSSSLSCSDSRSLPLYSLSFTRSSKR